MKSITINEKWPKRNKLFRIFTLLWVKRNTLVEIISNLYVILFLYTGLNKMVDLPINKILLSQSQVLEPFAAPLAWGIPIIEFIVALLLFFPRYRKIGFIAALSLMIVFTSYIIIVLTTSDELPCSCGGIIQQLSWPQHIIFNTIFIALAAIAIIILQKKYNLKKA